MVDVGGELKSGMRTAWAIVTGGEFIVVCVALKEKYFTD
jgi:hypothetical protein